MPPKKPQPPNEARLKYQAGLEKLYDEQIFRYLINRVHFYRQELANECPPSGWAAVTQRGTIFVHPTRRAEPEEWTYVLAHCLLHLAFGHFQPRLKAYEWNAACNYYIARFLADLKLGRSPYLLPDLYEFNANSEEKLFQFFCERGVPDYLKTLNPAGSDGNSLLFDPVSELNTAKIPDWTALFGQGLAASVASVVEQANGHSGWSGYRAKNKNSLAERARAWFINHYPLLGALAASFEIIEDQAICNRENISIAAVNPELREIYVSPCAGLNLEELKFVLAHELLHVGLRHDGRRQGRDPYYWNVACDFVINGWLKAMGIGEMPENGLLYDPDLKDLSAEAIYDEIVRNLRRYRHLATFRGVEMGDILDNPSPRWWESGPGCDLDEFYRRCLAQGLEAHQGQGRGFLPAGLVEQIRALHQPVIPWDVQLAQWFDERFPPLEKRRTYQRLSRRQSATPDIPRPVYVPRDAGESRTFGVVLDTSGSMDRDLLAKALGSIASYSQAHEVELVRVVFCDAAAYDQGYMSAELIAGQVKVRGRGGTVLQPGIDLLDKATDFPEDGPLLIITDAQCDRLKVRRDHAFLIPAGARLPFTPTGPVFRLR